MERSKIIPLMASIALLASGQASAQGAIDKSNLYGGIWNCEGEYSIPVTGDITPSGESGSLNVTYEGTSTYVRNGQSNGFVTVKMEYEPDKENEAQLSTESPVLEYVVSSNGAWEIDEGYLVEKVEGLKYGLVDPDASAEEKELFEWLKETTPGEISESSEILTLSRSILIVESETDGTVTKCYREDPKANNS